MSGAILNLTDFGLSTGWQAVEDFTSPFNFEGLRWAGSRRICHYDLSNSTIYYTKEASEDFSIKKFVITLFKIAVNFVFFFLPLIARTIYRANYDFQPSTERVVAEEQSRNSERLARARSNPALRSLIEVQQSARTQKLQDLTGRLIQQQERHIEETERLNARQATQKKKVAEDLSRIKQELAETELKIEQAREDKRAAEKQIADLNERLEDCADDKERVKIRRSIGRARDEAFRASTRLEGEESNYSAGKSTAKALRVLS